MQVVWPRTESHTESPQIISQVSDSGRCFAKFHDVKVTEMLGRVIPHAIHFAATAE